MLSRPSVGKAALAVAIVLLIMLATLAVVQEQQMAGLNRSLSNQPGTVVINGTRYAELEMPLSALRIPSSVMLDGVSFNLTSYVPETPGSVPIGFVYLTNATLLHQGQETRITITFGPTIRIIFGDGRSEYVGSTSPPTLQNGTTHIVVSSAASTWFSQHTSPRAGVSWNPSTEAYTFYVSLGP
jgi:hypothetical protein